MSAMLKKLEAFAAKRAPVASVCGVCGLPADVRELIRAGRARGLSLMLLADFLTTQGHKVSASLLGNHYRRGHEQGQ